MKKAAILGVGVLVVFLLALAGWQWMHVSGPTPVQARGDIENDILQQMAALNQRWWKTLPGKGGWLYRSREVENPLGKGREPDTDWPIFRAYRETQWYKFGPQGHVIAMVGRASSKEGPYVYRYGWMPGRDFRDPPFMGKSEDMPPPPATWPEHPVLDLCVGTARRLRSQATTFTLRVLSPGEQGVEAGQWGVVVRVEDRGVLIPDISQKYATVGVEYVCVWEKATARPVSQTQFYVLENGKRVRYARFADYEAKWVTKPPAEFDTFLEGGHR